MRYLDIEFAFEGGVEKLVAGGGGLRGEGGGIGGGKGGGLGGCGCCG